MPSLLWADETDLELFKTLLTLVLGGLTPVCKWEDSSALGVCIGSGRVSSFTKDRELQTAFSWLCHPCQEGVGGWLCR